MPPVGEMMDTEQTRAGALDQALGYGLLEPGVEATGVADRGVACGEGVLNGPGGLEVSQGCGLLDLPPREQTVVLVGEVVVCIDKTGH